MRSAKAKSARIPFTLPHLKKKSIDPPFQEKSSSTAIARSLLLCDPMDRDVDDLLNDELGDALLHDPILQLQRFHLNLKQGQVNNCSTVRICRMSFTTSMISSMICGTGISTISSTNPSSMHTVHERVELSPRSLPRHVGLDTSARTASRNVPRLVPAK